MDFQRCLQCRGAGVAFECITVTAADLKRGALSAFHVVVMPGGITTSQGKAIGRDGCKALRDFIASGGGYLGICAGANLALCEAYPNSLKVCLLPASSGRHGGGGTANPK